MRKHWGRCQGDTFLKYLEGICKKMDEKVYTVKMGGNFMKNWKKFILPTIVVAAVVIVLIASIKIVPAGSTGVVMTMGKVSDNVMQEGLNFKIPFVQTVSIVNNKIQVVELDAPAVFQGSSDGQQCNCGKLQSGTGLQR